jgi:ribonuclease HI
MNIVVYSDGGVTGENKEDKPCFCGYVTYLNGMELCSRSIVDIGTSNQAEYKGLILAIDDLNLLYASSDTTIKFKSDSKIMVNQVNGTFKAKDVKMIELLATVKQKMLKFTDAGFSVTIEHVKREKNKIADLLCNLAKQNIIKTNPFQSLSDFKKQHNLTKYKAFKGV